MRHRRIWGPRSPPVSRRYRPHLPIPTSCRWKAPARSTRTRAAAPAAAPQTSAPVAAATSPAGDPQLEYQTAFDALKQGRYDESSRLFAQFLRNNPDHDLADNAQYWLGESYYVTQNYETALQTFRAMTERYPDGDKSADAELKIGYCLYELGQYASAQQALQNVVTRYSGSTVARLAESRLRALALENP
jgi:tol-pal system protein YbgF